MVLATARFLRRRALAMTLVSSAVSRSDHVTFAGFWRPGLGLARRAFLAELGLIFNRSAPGPPGAGDLQKVWSSSGRSSAVTFSDKPIL